MIINPCTSKHRPTLKVKLSFLFCCPEHRVEADNWHQVSNVCVSSLWKGGVYFLSSPHWAIYRQNQQDTSPPQTFIHTHHIYTFILIDMSTFVLLIVHMGLNNSCHGSLSRLVQGNYINHQTISLPNIKTRWQRTAWTVETAAAATKHLLVLRFKSWDVYCHPGCTSKVVRDSLPEKLCYRYTKKVGLK